MAGTLTKRIVTAGVLVPAVLVLVFYGSNVQMAAGFAIVVLGCAWEWSGLGVRNTAVRWLYVLFLGAVLYVVWIYPDSSWVLVLIGVAWWVLATALVAAYQHRPERWHWLTHTPILVAVGFVTLVPAWTALVALHAHAQMGVSALVILFLLIWGADTAAYFSGRCFGKHKLASRVSPGKTWEGIAGALAAGLIIGIIGAWSMGLAPRVAAPFMVLCVVTVAFSVVGDLTESLFKRQAGVKDSGTLLPGHGGLLDRVDSLTAAAPVFLFGMSNLL